MTDSESMLNSCIMGIVESAFLKLMSPLRVQVLSSDANILIICFKISLS